MATLHKRQAAPHQLGERTIGQRFQELNIASSRAAAVLAAQGKRARLWGLLFSPFFTFLQTYLLRGEWHRGATGLITAIFAAYEVFVRQAKLWELQHGQAATRPPRL
jgi:hypothetical protein